MTYSYSSVRFASTSPILGEELRNNDIQRNHFAPQTLPPKSGGSTPRGEYDKNVSPQGRNLNKAKA